MNYDSDMVKNFAGHIVSLMPSSLVTFYGIYKARVMAESLSDKEAADNICAYKKIFDDSKPSDVDSQFVEKVNHAVFDLCARKVAVDAKSDKLLLSVVTSFVQAGFSTSKVQESQTPRGVSSELTISLNKKAFSIVVNNGDGSGDTCYPCETLANMNECFLLLRNIPEISSAFERHVFINMTDFIEDTGALSDDSFEFNKPISLSDDDSFFLDFLITLHSAKKFFDKLKKTSDKSTHFFDSKGHVKSFNRPDTPDSRKILSNSSIADFESFVF